MTYKIFGLFLYAAFIAMMVACNSSKTSTKSEVSLEVARTMEKNTLVRSDLLNALTNLEMSGIEIKINFNPNDSMPETTDKQWFSTPISATIKAEKARVTQSLHKSEQTSANSEVITADSISQQKKENQKSKSSSTPFASYFSALLLVIAAIVVAVTANKLLNK